MATYNEHRLYEVMLKFAQLRILAERQKEMRTMGEHVRELRKLRGHLSANC
jgi:hypothetical protein